MQSKLLHDDDGIRTFAVVLETGDEVTTCLQQFIDDEGISSATFSAIGAFSGAVLAYFDWEKKRYLHNAVGEQVEVASLNGDVAIAPDGKKTLHIHLVLGRRDGSAMAGHLVRATVRPTLEIVLAESPQHLRKVHDEESGLALIRPEA